MLDGATVMYGSASELRVTLLEAFLRNLLLNEKNELHKQKEDKVRNLLSSMRKKGIITTTSKNQQKSSWVLVDKTIQDK